MPSDAATAIAYVSAFVGLAGGGVAPFNSWKAVCWKRAELASSYLKDFNNNPELVFAGRLPAEILYSLPQKAGRKIYEDISA